MAEYNFYWRDFIDKKHWERSQFHELVLYSKQLIYDLTRSEKNSEDDLKRHESLTKPADRQDAAVRLALVYLVAKFDNWLNRIFSELWQSRRDMLHGWIRNQLPVIPGQKRDGEPSLAVALKDIWRGDYRHVQLGDYFEGEIHDMWSQKSPNDKLLALMDVLSLTFPSDVVEVYEKALKTRNEFVHPKDGNWPSKSKKPKRTGRLSPEFSLQWYDKVTETFTTIAETLSLRTRKACSRYIATNFRNLREYLSEKQRVAFGTFMKNSSDTYKTLELFVQALDDYKTKEMTLPEVVVLGTTQEVADKVPLLRKVARKHKDIPIILYGWPWSEGAGREGLKALETLALGNAQVTYIPEHIYPKGKYDATYKPEKVLQKKIKELTNT